MMAERIANKEAEGILIANMKAVSSKIKDGYNKAGKIAEVKGTVIH